MAAIPDLREELDRKAFETMQWLTHSLDLAKITAAQFSAGVDALFMTVSGLVDEDLMELITEASTQAATIDTSIKRYFIKGDSLMRATRRADETKVTTTLRTNGFATGGRIYESTTPKEAAAKLNQIAALMMKNGYTEI